MEGLFIHNVFCFPQSMEGLDHQRAVNLLKSVSGESLINKNYFGPWKLYWLTIIRSKNHNIVLVTLNMYRQLVSPLDLYLKTASIGFAKYYIF